MIVLLDAQRVNQRLLIYCGKCCLGTLWRDWRPVKNSWKGLTPMDQSAQPSIHLSMCEKPEILTQKGRFIMLKRYFVDEADESEEVKKKLCIDRCQDLSDAQICAQYSALHNLMPTLASVRLFTALSTISLPHDIQ